MAALRPFFAAGGAPLTAEIRGSGDADLYVRRGAKPSLDQYDACSRTGDSSDRCVVPVSGALFVGVFGYSAVSTFELEVTWIGAGPGLPTADP